MNKKLKKYLDDGERMEKRIQEMQEQLRAVRSAQELEENKEIVKSFRGMKLDGRELFSLLCGLQDGSVTFQRAENGGGTFQKTGKTADISENPDADGQAAGNGTEDQKQDNKEFISKESEDKGNEKKMDEDA